MSNSISAVISDISKKLKAAGIEACRLDARNIVSMALRTNPNDLVVHTDRVMTDVECVAVESLVQRRLQGEPISRIRGEREFWGLPFIVSPYTLDPRPDSETIVSAVLDVYTADHPNDPRTLLDLGTGSGCLLLALLSEFQNAFGLGVDISEHAIDTAKLNADRLGLGNRSAFLVDNWAASLAGQFDVIVCNPPYLETGELTGLQPEVRLFDPVRALNGGPDGLDSYRCVIPDAKRLLGGSGILVMEIGYDQKEAITSLLETAGLVGIQGHTDLAGITRCLSCTLS